MEIPKYADPIEDIAESLRILSGRTTLKEIRLMEEIGSLFNVCHRIPLSEMENLDKINKRIKELEDELESARSRRMRNENSIVQ